MEYWRQELYYSDYLSHHGTKGQKWGRRQYQYEDGSLTPAGRDHYGVGEKTAKKHTDKSADPTPKHIAKARLKISKMNEKKLMRSLNGYYNSARIANQSLLLRKSKLAKRRKEEAGEYARAVSARRKELDGLIRVAEARGQKDVLKRLRKRRKQLNFYDER